MPPPHASAARARPRPPKPCPIFQLNPELANFVLRIDALQQSLNQKTTLIFDERTPPFDLFTHLPTNARGEMKSAMSDDHEHHDHDHGHPAPPPVTADDTGSQALAEALRSSFAIVKVVMVLMVLVFFGSGFFQVEPQEKAVILRFGRLSGEGTKALLGPGLHWSFPYPIDEVVRIPITEIQKVSSNIGWYFTTPEQELSGEELPAGPSLNPAVDGYVITADRNILHLRATLYYQIDDPIRAVFGFSSGTNLTYDLAGVSNAVQNALDNALVYTAAHFKVDDILCCDVSDVSATPCASASANWWTGTTSASA